MTDLSEIVDLLESIDCHSYTLHATDCTFYSARNPNAEAAKRTDLRLTIIGRTAFEQMCERLKAKPLERIVHFGQRAWWAASDTDTRRLLIEGVSFQHHDDWQPREASR